MSGTYSKYGYTRNVFVLLREGIGPVACSIFSAIHFSHCLESVLDDIYLVVILYFLETDFMKYPNDELP
jgi:hypothetical protein